MTPVQQWPSRGTGARMSAIQRSNPTASRRRTAQSPSSTNLKMTTAKATLRRRCRTRGPRRVGPRRPPRRRPRGPRGSRIPWPPRTSPDPRAT